MLAVRKIDEATFQFLCTHSKKKNKKQKTRREGKRKTFPQHSHAHNLSEINVKDIAKCAGVEQRQRLSFKPLGVFCPWGNQSVLMAPQLNQKDCHKTKKKRN